MTTLAADLRVGNPWRTALPAWLAVVALIGVLYRDTLTTMVGIWYRSETFAHGFLVLPIALWLVWRKRTELAALTPAASSLWLALLAVLGVAWLLAELVVVNAATQFAVVGMLVLSVPAVLGLHIARAMMFPLLFLFFGVPFGEFMLPPMMDWTADFTVAALQLTGVPVYREGLQFVIPTGSWSVIDECSGVRYLIASFMVGSLFAYLNYSSYKRRVLFMGISILVPIVANWLRAYMIVMMGHLSGNKIAVGVDHILYGWVFFGIVIFIMFTIGARWSEPERALVQPGEGGAVAGASGSPGRLAAAVVGALALVSLPHAVLWGLEKRESAAGEPRFTLPAGFGNGWQSQGAELVEFKPYYRNPSVEARQAYRGAAGTVGVHVGYYRGQSGERKLIGNMNDVVWLNDRTWNRVSRGRTAVDTSAGPVSVRTSEILGPGGAASGKPRAHLMAYSVYWIDGRWVAGDVQAKLVGAFTRLLGRGDEGAIVVLYADEPTLARSTAAVEAFAREQLPALGELLRQTHGQR